MILKFYVMIFQLKARYYVFAKLTSAACPHQAFPEYLTENAEATLAGE